MTATTANLATKITNDFKDNINTGFRYMVWKVGGCGKFCWGKGRRRDLPNTDMSVRFLNFLTG
jgi:hypothetical protein